MKRGLIRLLTMTATGAAAALMLTSSGAVQARFAARVPIDDVSAATSAARVQPASNGAATLRVASGQYITPTAIDGSTQQYLNPHLPNYPDFVAGMAVRSRLSPDGQTLAVLTAGHNSLYKPDGTVDVANSTQYIFLFDVSDPSRPSQKQVIKQINSHVGLVFSPDGQTLYAAGGVDDAVYVYANAGSQFVAAAPIALGHFPPGAVGSARNTALGINVAPNASGLDISADGRTLVVANNYNDSISVIDTQSRTVRYEHDLRPYFARNEGHNGGVGGTFPYGIAIKGNDVAYVSSDRDREVIVIDISSATEGRLIARVPLDGNGLGMTLDAEQARLYVAQDNADQVAVIDTATNLVVKRIDARAPAAILPHGRNYTGASTSAVTLSPDGQTLYAVNSGANSIAVIRRTGQNAYTVVGLIPTAYEPHDITFTPDGSWMFIINGKSITGPNPGHLASSTANITSIQYPDGNQAAAIASRASNQYQFQLERASLVAAPVPAPDRLADLTQIVARNNFYTAPSDQRDERVMRFLRQHIKHVIYVVKENRTFDQVLGDLTNGASVDPSLTQFPYAATPNNHKLATGFVTIDNFMNPGDGSMDGWSWTMQGRVTNTETITQQINYAAVNRGLSYESEGGNRGVPVNWSTVAERDAVAGLPGTTNYSTRTAGLLGGTANLLTGSHNHASTDAPFGIERGFIFDAVLHAGKTVRNYGFLVNNIGSIGTKAVPVRDPFAEGKVQVAPLDPALASMTDLYFRGYDQNYPDLWRYNEWKREFDQFVASGNLPNLSLVRISHDHMGSFGTALGLVNTPESQQADCDMALGLIIQAVANSPFAKDTLIISTEDDVQDGPDHVDSHRGTVFFAGPYVKQGGEVVSTRYSQVNVLRTIEDILGTEHINLNTAFQSPMIDVFDTSLSGEWSYVAEASTYLQGTEVGGGLLYVKGPTLTPTRPASYWAKVTEAFDFSEADQVPPARFNRVLWEGLMGNRPYPALRGRAGNDLPQHLAWMQWR